MKPTIPLNQLMLFLAAEADSKKEFTDKLERAISNIGISCHYTIHDVSRIPSSGQYLGDVTITLTNRENKREAKRLESLLAASFSVSHNPDRQPEQAATVTRIDTDD